MFRAQRLGNGVFFAQPFAEINELATFGAEWRERSVQPIAGLFARGTFELFGVAHERNIAGIVNGFEEFQFFE